MSQEEEGTDIPIPTGPPTGVQLVPVLEGWEVSCPRPGPFSCSSICCPAVCPSFGPPSSPKPEPKTEDWKKDTKDRCHQETHSDLTKPVLVLLNNIPQYT